MCDSLVGRAFFKLCQSVDSPKSLGLWLRYRYAHSELANATIDPLAYNDVEAFFADYACVNLLRKYEGLDTGIDTREVSLLGFDKSEDRCAAENSKLRTFASTGRIDQVESAIVARIQQLIADVWGHPSFGDLFHHCGWGPGSTATLKGARSTTEDKMSELPMSVTPSALPFLRQVMKYDFAWVRHLIKQDVDGPVCLMPSCYSQIDHSRLLTVPKDAKTDRVIAAEPTGNIFLQKGVGAYMRRRLRRYHVDLSDQQKNQELAEISASHRLATLDLSAASDTISIGLCRALLPLHMFDILNALRSPAYKLGGIVRPFHKFSSMGNGFTFELESLIFWATAKAVQEYLCCEGPIGVYGDDIIVPQRMSEVLIRVLEAFGFEINRRKSFVSGRFFESCGKHYFDGVDVTPVYQKNVVDNDLEISRFFNRIFSLAFERPYLGSEKIFGKVHASLFAQLSPKFNKLTAPGWVQGDGFFRVNNWHGRTVFGRGIQIHYMNCRRPRQVKADGGLYAYVLRKQADSGDNKPEYTLLDDSVHLRSLGAAGLSAFVIRRNDTPLSLTEATGGMVTPRPKGRVVNYTLSKRWVSCSFGTGRS